MKLVSHWEELFRFIENIYTRRKNALGWKKNSFSGNNYFLARMEVQIKIFFSKKNIHKNSFLTEQFFSQFFKYFFLILFRDILQRRIKMCFLALKRCNNSKNKVHICINVGRCLTVLDEWHLFQASSSQAFKNIF